MSELNRYSRITTKLPREFLLLQGQGCFWKQCAFCDYHTDVSAQPFLVNRPVIQQVTGEFGVLDVINSGSVTELDEETLTLLGETVKKKKIHTIWFESHWLCRDKLKEIANRFPSATVKFRCGVETFDGKQRAAWRKGIPAAVTPQDIANYFSGVCLLIGVEGQTRDMIANDIQTALKYFEYFSVNAFVENSTPLKRDSNLVGWFASTLLPDLEALDNVEVLLHNTDLGVG